MKQSHIKARMQENAEICRQLHARVHETYKRRSKGPKEHKAWEQACADFRARYAVVAFPGGYDGALERILAGDAYTIEVALCFVEVRPYFFRSGYMYDALLRKLKRAPLDPAQAERLAAVLARLAEWRKLKQQRSDATR